MTMTVDPERARPYDRFKLIVAVILAALLIIFCLLAQSAAQVAGSPTATAAPAPATAAPRPTEPPPVSLAAPTVNAAVNAGAVTLTGTGTPNSTVQIVVDGQVAGTAKVDGNGQWRFDADLAPGDHDIVANALDAGGIVAASAAPLRVAVPLPLVAPSLDALASGLAPGKIPLSGTGSPNSTVQVVIDGQLAGTATVGADGKWTFEADLAAGEHKLEAKALDAAGAVAAAAAPVNVRLAEAAQLAAPVLDLPATPLTVGTQTLTGAGTPGSNVTYTITGTTGGGGGLLDPLGADGRWSFDFDFTAAGDYVVALAASSADGSQTLAAEPVTLTIGSATAQAPTITAPAEGGTVTDDALTVRGTGTPGSTVQVLVDGQAVGTATVGANGEWELATGLTPGKHVITAQSVEATGKSLAASAPVNVERKAEAGGGIPIKDICDFSDPTVYGEDMGTYWLVDRCDTMSYIARRTNIPLAALIAANPQVKNPDLIYPQQQIVLPGR